VLQRGVGNGEAQGEEPKIKRKPHGTEWAPVGLNMQEKNYFFAFAFGFFLGSASYLKDRFTLAR
jgi:hypothetical protein